MNKNDSTNNPSATDVRFEIECCHRRHKKSEATAGPPPEDSVDVSERQPAFLKDKGDALYRQVRAIVPTALLFKLLWLLWVVF